MIVMCKIGYHHSEETRGKISEAMKGSIVSEETRRKISEATKGRQPWNFGKHWSKEMKEKFRKGSLGNKNHLGFRHVFSEEAKRNISRSLFGSNNPAWRGGLSFEPYGSEFNGYLKSKIRQRDNFACQLCGRPQSELPIPLNVHHIDYNKKNNEESNLISLCPSCNSKVNTRREYWINYFKSCQVIVLWV